MSKQKVRAFASLAGQNANAIDDNKHLVQNSACQTDIQTHCKQLIAQLAPGAVLNDIAALECLQDVGISEQGKLDPTCAQTVWEYKVRFFVQFAFQLGTLNARSFESQLLSMQLAVFLDSFNARSAFHPSCSTVLRPRTSSERKSDALPRRHAARLCALVRHGSRPQNSARHAMLQVSWWAFFICKRQYPTAFFQVRTERLAFSDFRLIAPFVDECGDLVQRLGCGTLTKISAHQGARYPHSQGQTLECIIGQMVCIFCLTINIKTRFILQVNPPKNQENAKLIKEMTDGCRKEVMRLAELQSEDFHVRCGFFCFLQFAIRHFAFQMDRTLYFACRGDRERFCHEVQAGDGKVFQCLVEHKDDKQMEPEVGKQKALLGVLTLKTAF